MSMRLKAAITIVLIVFVVTAASFLTSMFLATRGMKSTMAQDQSLNRNLANDFVSVEINTLELNAAEAARNYQRAKSEDERSGVMTALFNDYPNFTAFTIIDRNGVRASYGKAPASYSFLENSPYLSSAFSGKSAISTTYNDELTGELVFYLCVPAGDKAVLAVTIPGLFFAKLLDEYRLRESGSIYLVDKEGTIVAHYNFERVNERHNYIELAKTDPAYKSAGVFFQNMISSKEGEGRYTLDGKERICMYTQISSPVADWKVGVVALLDESPQSGLRRGLILSALLFLAAGGVASIFLSGLVARPFNTIRKQADKIEEAHKHARLLLDATPLACHLWNRNFELFECNEENERLFKVNDRQDFMKRFFDYTPEYQPDGRSSVETARILIQKAFDEGKCVGECMFKASDGAQIPAEVTFVRVAYEGDYVVAVYLRDLREHQKMMNEIERRDYLLNKVNQAANILLQLETVEFERNLQRCIGMMGEAVDADRVSIWKNYDRDGKLRCTQIFEWLNNAKSQISGKEIIDIDYGEKLPGWEEILSQGKCINGLVRDMSPQVREQLEAMEIVSFFLSPIFVQGKFWGLIGFDNCRYEYLYNENEQSILNSGGLLIANALLRNEMTLSLQTTAVQLEAALTDARNANNAKSDFLAKMSHEMRTPLNAVIGLSGLSLDGGGLNEEDFANLEKIYNAGTTLLSTVNDILDISKIEAGKLELVEVDYDVPSLINDSVTQNLLYIGEKPIKLVLDIGRDMYSQLHGDELRVKQIMNNLLSNAIKYTMEGAVQLTARCVREGDTVWLSIQVRDTGRGIRPEDINKLFYDYSQLELERNRKIEGAGLGLSITQKLINMMGGEITVESEYGKGSVFTAKFRQKFVTDVTIGPEVIESLRSFHYSDGRRGGNTRLNRINLPYARVLIVDDNMTNLEVAKGLMKPYGMQIDCVTDGRQAIDAIRGEEVKYNAVFMDHMMPGMDGIEATSLIREIGTDYAKNIPVIALTANAVAGNEELFLRKGFQAFLSKPINISRLDEVIRRFVRNKEQEAQFAETHDRQVSPDIQDPKNRRKIIDRRSGIDRRKANRKIAGLDIKKGIERFGGDKETYINILRSYVVNTRPLLASITKISRDMLADYAIIVHGIKGSSYGIFMEMIGNSAENLEKAAKAGDYDYVFTHNPTFLDAAWKLIHDLENMLSDIDEENPKPEKEKLDGETLSRLLAACEAYDMDAVDAAMADIDNYRYAADNVLVDWLRKNVKMMNFGQIIERLR